MTKTASSISFLKSLQLSGIVTHLWDGNFSSIPTIVHLIFAGGFFFARLRSNTLCGWQLQLAHVSFSFVVIKVRVFLVHMECVCVWGNLSIDFCLMDTLEGYE